MNERAWRRWLLAGALAVVCAGGLTAQSTFGTIVGTITDSTGAVVPRVTVTVTHQEENVARQAVADEQGNFQALNLKAGTYTVAVEAPGFKSARKAGIPLDARQTVRVDFTLEVGQLTEQVTVEAVVNVINTETQTIGARFDNRQVVDLPLNFRGAGSTSPYRALAYLPGVQSDNGLSFAVQGGLPHQTEVSVDGISTVSVRSNGPLTELFPSVENIAEMKVQAVGNNAEYGQIGDITTTSRGGSNAYHGSLFEYLQNRALDATSFGSVTKPQKTANTFGGSASGPVLRNKLFFFGDFERMSYRRGATIQNTVPTQLQRNGDFINEPRAIRDPLTGEAYPNKRIPASQISSIAPKILAFYPLPNFGTTDRQAASNFRENRAAPITSNQYDARVDYAISSQQQVFGRWTWKKVDTVANNNLALPDDTQANRSKSLTVSHNYTLNPRMLNEFRIGFAFNDNERQYAFDGRSIVGGFGFQGLGPFPYNGLTGIAFSGATTNFGKSKAPFTYSRNIQFNDNYTWIKGRHTMKFGFDFRRLRAAADVNFFGEDDYGRFSFNGTFSGDDFADFLLGLPNQSSLAKTGLDTDGRSRHYSLYAQDSFKATSKLTLELGLRWEYHRPFEDAAYNITNFDRAVPVTGRVIIPTAPEAAKLTAPGFALSINACPAPNATQFNLPCTPFLTAKDAGFPEYLRFPDKRNFNPRFGFAYRPFGGAKTVVRGGFGVYTMTVLGAVFYSLTAIHGSDIRTFVNGLSGGRPLFQWPQISTGGSGVGTPTYGNAYFGTAVQPTYRDPYLMQYSLTLEQDLGWSSGLRVSFIGNRGVQLPWAPDLNQPQPSTTPFTQRPLTDRPFPYWERIYSRDTGGNSVYNSAQVEFIHRYRSGLTFDSGWTWANSLSDVNGASSGYTGETGGGRVADSLHRRLDRGPVGPIRRHRWTTTAIYELPFGHGRPMLNQAHPVVNAIAGGWSVSGILLLQTGPYLTALMSGGDPSGSNGPARGNQRPDAIGQANLDNPTADVWWNRDAFICPGRTPGAADRFSCNVAPIGRFGNAGTGTLLGPGTVALNFGFAKHFPIREGMRLRFEGSFTNLPNHPNLNDPGVNITAISFGRTTSARGADAGGNRVGQFALRLEF